MPGLFQTRKGEVRSGHTLEIYILNVYKLCLD